MLLLDCVAYCHLGNSTQAFISLSWILNNASIIFQSPNHQLCWIVFFVQKPHAFCYPLHAAVGLRHYLGEWRDPLKQSSMSKLLPSQLYASLTLCAPLPFPILLSKCFLSGLRYSKYGSNPISRGKGGQSGEGKIYKPPPSHVHFPFSFRLSCSPPKEITLAKASQLSCLWLPTPPLLKRVAWMDVWGVFRLWVDRKNPLHTVSSHTKLTKDIVLPLARGKI